MFDHLWIIYPCFCFCRLIIFICGFAAKITCTFFAYKRQWRNSQKKNTVRVRKTMLSSTFMIRLQGYSWKSGIAFIAWGGERQNYVNYPWNVSYLNPLLPPIQVLAGYFNPKLSSGVLRNIYSELTDAGLQVLQEQVFLIVSRL